MCEYPIVVGSEQSNLPNEILVYYIIQAPLKTHSLHIQFMLSHIKKWSKPNHNFSSIQIPNI